MDSNSIAVLEKICSLAATGRYVVFSEDELCAPLPDDADVCEALKTALKELKDCGFIDLRYSSGNLYCIAPLKTYSPPKETISVPEPATEAQPPAKNDDKGAKLKYMTGAFFLSAFFGGALGSLIVSLAFAFV